MPMNHPWHLIRGVGLFRPATPQLMEFVLEIARKHEREWEEVCAPLRSLISEREFLETQIEEMQRLVQSFSTEISSFRHMGRDGQVDELERIRVSCEHRCVELQAKLVAMQAEQEALTAQFQGLHDQLQRICVRYLMLATGDDRQACLHRLEIVREELAHERARDLRAGAKRGIRASAKAAFEVFTNLLVQKQAQQQLDDVFGWEEEKSHGGGWDCV